MRSFFILTDIKSLGQGGGPDHREHQSETLNGTCHGITSRLVSLIEALGIEEGKNGGKVSRHARRKKDRKEEREDCAKQSTHRGVIYFFQRAQGPGRVFRCG